MRSISKWSILISGSNAKHEIDMTLHDLKKPPYPGVLEDAVNIEDLNTLDECEIKLHFRNSPNLHAFKVKIQGNEMKRDNPYKDSTFTFALPYKRIIEVGDTDYHQDSYHILIKFEETDIGKDKFEWKTVSLSCDPKCNPENMEIIFNLPRIPKHKQIILKLLKLNKIDSLYEIERNDPLGFPDTADNILKDKGKVKYHHSKLNEYSGIGFGYKIPELKLTTHVFTYLAGLLTQNSYEVISKFIQGGS